MSQEPTTTLPKVSGVRTALRYTGIPPSWLDKRPKLPSRNWLIFLSTVSSILGMYVYDRRQCKQIRQAYVDKVKHLAQVPSDPFDSPRKVTVYASKWPGDEDYDQSLKYFRKYVKPILVAAAVDYEMIPGKRHGDIARRVAEDTRIRRRFDLGLDSDSEATKLLPTYKPLAQRRKRELEGGVVIIGRPTLKEFMFGLHQGWSEGVEKKDADEALARILEEDTHFDEPEDLSNDPDDSPSGSKFPSSSSSPMFSPLQLRAPTKPSTLQEPSASTMPETAPIQIPPLPPLLLVPFTNYIGLSQIPLMLWDFFNQRHKVRSGAQAGYRLVANETRPFQVPGNHDLSYAKEDPQHQIITGGDLDFDRQAEGYFKKSLHSLPEEIERARTKYYGSLAGKLENARGLARGTKEPTKEELQNPPSTEVELRAERFKKERRWRDDLQGWEIVKPSSNVVWDARFQDSLRIFIDPQNDRPLDDTKAE